MILTAKAKLQPTEAQADCLKRTLETANAACDFISDVAWKERVFGKFQIQKLVYHYVRNDFALTAQLVIRCIAKVTDAYKLDRKTKRQFDPLGSIAFDSRILSWNLDKNEISIWTVEGRQKMPILAHDRAKELLSGSRGESDLCLIDGEFYLFTSCEVNEPTPKDVDDFLGVDMGVKNIASDSDGTQYSGGKVNSLRHRHAKLRAKLQSVGSKQAKRLLVKRSRKEKRFAKDVNHQISKQLVERAKGTSRGIALEELTGIRERVTVRKAQRRQHSAWSFHDLRSKIEYKAQLHGVPLVLVDPRNTSKACNACGCIDSANRKNQATFLCVSCGHSANADTNAARNIARRAAVNLPYIPERVLRHPGTSPRASAVGS
jgi:putative transposase